MKAFLVAFGLASLPASGEDFNLPRSTAAGKIDFEADRLDYRRAEQELRLEGNVKVLQASRTLKSDALEIDLKKDIAESPGPVVVEQDKLVLRGESGRFSLGPQEGEIRGAHVAYDSWSVKSSKLRLEDGVHRFRWAGMTSCDFDSPHYHLKASSIRVKPKKSLVAWNVFFFLGRVPIFYFPYLYRNLNPAGGLRIVHQPAYDKRNGLTLYTTVSYDAAEGVVLRGFADVFALRGFGHGGEIGLSRGSGQGTLYGYRILERDGLGERWTLLGSLSQELPFGKGGGGQARYRFQGFFRNPSDPTFNEDYHRDNAFIVSPNRERSLAFVRQTDVTTSRLSYSRTDRASADGRSFLTGDSALPRVDFSRVPTRFKKLPWLHRFSAFYQRTDPAGGGRVIDDANADYELSETYKLSRSWRVIPSAGYTQTFRDAVAEKSQFQGTYRSGLALRGSRKGAALDLSYNYARRLRTNRLSVERDADDRGVTTSKTSGRVTFRPSRRLFLRSFTGYDWRDLRSGRRSFQQRLDPVVTDLSIYPGGTASLYARADVQVGTGLRSFLFQADRGDPEGTFGGLGASYTRESSSLFAASASGESYLLHATAGFKPKKGSWRIEGAFRSKLLQSGSRGTRFREILSFERSLILHKRFHDFKTRWMVRARPNATEFFVNVELAMPFRKDEVSESKAPEQTAVEQEAYPWRRGKGR